MAGEEENVEERIAALEDKVSRLAERCEELEWRIKRLSVVKSAKAGYALWDWVLGRGLTSEEHRRLMHVLSVLDARAEGVGIPGILRKEVEGVRSEVLYSSSALQVEEAVKVLEELLGGSEEEAMEVLRAAREQGVYGNLTALLVVR